MASNKKKKTTPRTVRGFTDLSKSKLHYLRQMINSLTDSYEKYGFEELETPMVEYTEILGKFLPDTDRPNAGVFSLQDEDDQWLSLRYDLTAPLARYVAENFETLPKPFKSFRHGWVFRNEKAGPYRFRQFMQFDADIVGSSNMLADAEICMMAVDALIGLGIDKDNFVIRLNNRKILDGVLELAGLDGDDKAEVRLIVLRAIDKLDKFGTEGVKLLLGKGRLDESGDFTQGAELSDEQIDKIIYYVSNTSASQEDIFEHLKLSVGDSKIGLEGVEELRLMQNIFKSAGYQDNIKIDPSIVRGLDYYTGPVFEATLVDKVNSEDGQTRVMGSIGGGGRYDSLVSRFRSEPVPATGFSIGLSRLLTALENLNCLAPINHDPLVLVAVMDKDLDSISIYQQMVKQLRSEGIKAEMYVGTAGLKAQMKYADRRGAACVILQGSQERESGTVEIKDLVEGLKLSQTISNHSEWKELRPAQINVKTEDMVATVKDILQKLN